MESPIASRSHWLALSGDAWAAVDPISGEDATPTARPTKPGSTPSLAGSQLKSHLTDSCGFSVIAPPLGTSAHLLDEHTHRQAVHQLLRRFGGALLSSPEP